jgi:predicted O-linked N-acetylglucosamine transferase (SPINDLY family)
LRTEASHFDAVVGLADVLEALGRNVEAISLLEGALARSPFAAPLHGRLADALHAQGVLPRAIETYHKTVAMAPTSAGAWWGLGCAQASLGDHAVAVESFQRLLELQPENGMALHNLGKSLFELGEVDSAIHAFRKAVDHLAPEMQGLPLGNIAIAIPGSPTANNQDIIEARRNWATRCLSPAPVDKVFPGRLDDPLRPLRLAYLSAFFAKPNWMKPVWGLINHHDSDRFEIHVFSDGPEPDPQHGYHQVPRVRFHNVKGLSNADLARLIEALQIDLCIDLNAYSKPSRLPLFLLRPAPVQVAWFAMFATSGLDAFDYLVGDEHVIPSGEEVFYTEQVVRVPGCYMTFAVPYPVPEVAPAPCLERGYLTFGCLAPQYKITTRVVEAWSRILRESSGTRLVLKNYALAKPATRDLVHRLFARFSIPAERVDLDGPAEHFTFLERYADIDVALDTFPYNGGTTTTEALWQGVPVVAFAGDRWAARISASLLREAGLPEYAALDLDGYVASAVTLARDPDAPARLDLLRRTMRERLRRAPVCNVRSFTREMERAYLEMWRRHGERS